jgi:hypothetical protein
MLGGGIGKSGVVFAQNRPECVWGDLGEQLVLKTHESATHSGPTIGLEGGSLPIARRNCEGKFPVLLPKLKMGDSHNQHKL